MGVIIAKFTLINHENGERKRIDYPFSARNYVKINFLMWGFYQVVYDGKQYNVFDTFEKKQVYPYCGVYVQSCGVEQEQDQSASDCVEKLVFYGT